MVRCAVTALEKMKEMFGAALGTVNESPNNPGTGVSGCVMDTKCKSQGCPFRGTGVAPNVLETFCKKDGKSMALKSNGRSDRNAMRLLPGEVGLRGDRATFHLGPTAAITGEQPVGGDRPTGAVYYNMRPGAAKRRTDGSKQPNQASVTQQQRKHVMQVLPSLPTSKGPAVGPVTGLPIGNDEHVFVLRLNKRYDEPDEKARLQIELRLPKQRSLTAVDADTQYANVDIKPPEPAQPKKKKGGKKGGKKAAGKQKTAEKKKAAGKR